MPGHFRIGTGARGPAGIVRFAIPVRPPASGPPRGYDPHPLPDGHRNSACATAHVRRADGPRRNREAPPGRIGTVPKGFRRPSR